MDRDKDARLTFDEFVEGSKHDPTIVQVGYIANVIVLLFLTVLACRHYRCMMVLYSFMSSLCKCVILWNK